MGDEQFDAERVSTNTETAVDVGPSLTIGVPVHNGARTLRRTLDALLSQTFQNFEIHISDNASTDMTPAICAEYSARDKRIRVFRRSELLSPSRNFETLLQPAQTEYFMFSAADDWVGPTFVERNIANLTSNMNAVCSVTKAVFLSEGNEPIPLRGTRSIFGAPHHRIVDYLRDPSDNSRIYGVFRTGILKQCFVADSIIGGDWLIMALTLLRGDHLEVGETLLFREITPIEDYRNSVLKVERGVPGRVIPLYKFAFKLLRRLPPKIAVIAIPRLLYLVLFYTNVSPYSLVRNIRQGISVGMKRLDRSAL